MARPVYRMIEGSMHDRFQRSRAKIQFLGGGFGNGKTAGSCVKVISIIKDYPGANILIARATYPKLNDTIRKEFLKWLPRDWIKSINKTENTIELKNGATVNFRYVAQTAKNTESSTSNLLSATYDLIVVDQIEDPEITYKDFLDLLGRLRGMAKYVGTDPTMPRSGPRWMIITSNPTRNWVYRQLVRPMHLYLKNKTRDANLLVDPDTGEPIIDLFEGSTYENAENLEPDFIKTLEATYKGQMRDRFLKGEWVAYEGLVYPQFSEDVHVIPHDLILEYMQTMHKRGYRPAFLEGFDYGVSVPSCYLAGFTDHNKNVFLIDGFHEAELLISQMSQMIFEIRQQYHIDLTNPVHADPAIFRRVQGGHKTVGKATSDMFKDDGITMIRGNSDIMNGITKVQSYLYVDKMHEHPIFNVMGAPRLYISSQLEFVISEFTEYYWKKNTDGTSSDMPVDKNDHAMDTIKYLLSRVPKVATFVPQTKQQLPPYMMNWSEYEQSQTDNNVSHRHK